MNFVIFLVNFSWDISEAIRMHTVSKQPFPGNVKEMLTSQQASRQQLSSSMLRLCVQFHTRQHVRCDDGDNGTGGDGVMGGDGAGGVGDSGDMCAVVMMEYVCKVLSEWTEEERGGEVGSDHAATSLIIMSQWVESSGLATPTLPKMVSSET